MNTSSTLILTTGLALLTFASTSCKKCKDENPRVRIANNGSQRASVQVQTSGGNTVNLNNVDPGVTSDYASYAPGNATFTLKVSGVDYAKTLDVRTCHEYTIAIDRANVITVSDTDRND
ncbi:hypothetical protein GCM10023185_17970 [Hymenobacter saemangeumensis]|uniref:Uncharacterized protein n=1 Tax=Hymenobacter saemangeumensis TaxID=1084522 RepID=A0ABP8IBI5_9BACT